MKTLYVSDLDGTLLNDFSFINENSLKILNSLIDRGVAFTFATARSMNSAAKVIQGLHLRIPFIVYNGVYVLDSEDHHIIAQQGFTRRETKKILELAQKHAQIPFVYAYVDGKERVSYIAETLHPGGWHYLHNRPQDERFRRVEQIERLYDGDCFYVTFIGEEADLKPIYKELEALDMFTVTFQRELGREEFWLEVMPATASKANAILKLKELGGYDYVVSFGDAINDVPMFRVSDEAYAVENAIEELKKCATGIIASNQNDGVAKWMEAHALKK